MSERNTLVRSMHDVGLAAWFGGSLMGATGLNGATSEAASPVERLRLSNLGWAKWTPWQIAAVGTHAVGGVGLILSNRNRLVVQPAASSNTAVKLVLTAAAAGVTAYSGVLGAKLRKFESEGAASATEPKADSSPEQKSAQQQLKITQWVIPALTGVLLVMGAAQGEQQRGIAGLADLNADESKRGLKQSLLKSAA